MWDSDLLPLGENLYSYSYSPVCGLLTWGKDLTILHFHLSFPSCCGSFFIFLVVEDLFCWILVVLISSCSVNISCIFGVPMGDEFSVSLLHHLDHIHFISFISVL